MVKSLGVTVDRAQGLRGLGAAAAPETRPGSWRLALSRPAAHANGRGRKPRARSPGSYLTISASNPKKPDSQ